MTELEELKEALDKAEEVAIKASRDSNEAMKNYYKAEDAYVEAKERDDNFNKQGN